MSDSTSEILRHNRLVGKSMNELAHRLTHAAAAHDKDKLDPRVKSLWDFFHPRPAISFGTPEYYRHLETLANPLQEHYRVADHHPEHFANGFNDFNFIQLLEWFCDIIDVCKTHGDGDVLRSLDISAERFGIAPQLVRIMQNTLRDMEWL